MKTNTAINGVNGHFHNEIDFLVVLGWRGSASYLYLFAAGVQASGFFPGRVLLARPLASVLAAVHAATVGTRLRMLTQLYAVQQQIQSPYLLLILAVYFGYVVTGRYVMSLWHCGTQYDGLQLNF